MKRLRPCAVLLCAVPLAATVSRAQAEPIFLSRQYTRCTTCHYSPTGGGLLTPYGRFLTREDLSTLGRGHATAAPAGSASDEVGEQSFLWGALGRRLGALNLGIDLRPGHLDVRFPGGKDTRNLLMNAELIAAYQVKGWTLYGDFGRQPFASGTRVFSWEHWVSHQSASGLGLRAGRFLPAYGVRFADHTAFNRRALGLDTFDQIYGVEVSHTGERHLLQVVAGPGRADSIIHDDGLRAFTAAGRVQLDLSPRSALVFSGLFHHSSRLLARNGSGGIALGFAPTAHVSVWTEANAQFQQGSPGAPAYTVINETGFEVFRGVWLKVSPQIRTALGDTSGGVLRWAFELNVLPRTHWNVDLSYYRDRGRRNDIVIKTTLLQLHLYL